MTDIVTEMGGDKAIDTQLAMAVVVVKTLVGTVASTRKWGDMI